MSESDVKLNISENAKRVLERRYLKKDLQGKITETPKEMLERVAGNIAQADAAYDKRADLKKIKEEFYSVISRFDFLPNSPTLMNAGKDLQQLSACFVLPIRDSMEGIFDSLKSAALIHKCLTPETLLSTEKGLKRLKKIRIGDKILTDEGYFKVKDLYENKGQIVYEISTNRGFIIKGTSEHKLLAVSENGDFIWREIGELNEGDWVVMQPPGRLLGGDDSLPAFKPSMRRQVNSGCFKAQKVKFLRRLTPELAEMIGVYIGDGSNHRDGIRFSVGKDDDEMVQIINRLSKTVFNKKASVSSTANRGYEVAILSILVKKWFEFLGITKPSSRKAHIPEIIFGATEEIICAFLRGLFSADGCIRKSGHITLTTSSRVLSEELQFLMFYIGVPTHRRHYKSTDSYQISICTKEGFINFKQKIGFLLSRKNERLAGISPEDIFKRGEVIPNQRILIKDWYAKLGDREKRYEARLSFDDILNRFSEPREISRQRITSVLEKNKICPQFLETLLNKNYFFVGVSKVNPLGVMDTYDITVSGRHTYLANGFITHNSGGGTGFSFSSLRPKNSVVKTTGGVASGPVSFMKVFDAATQAVKQGGTRRGANMGILRVDHPDIMEFITCKENSKDITNFNISVMITDEFMKKVGEGGTYSLIDPHSRKKVGELNAKEIFEVIVKMAWKNGEPGIIFYDRLNKDNPTPKIGSIESTNPCVIGDTFVSTEKGLMRIKGLAEQYSNGGIDIFTDDRALDILYGGGESGNLAVETKSGLSLNTISRAFKTGIKPVLRITTESGYELAATHDHKVMTPDGWVKAEDLKEGEDRVLIQSNPGQFNSDDELPFEVQNEYIGENGRAYKLNLPNKWSKELGRILGWLVGDGWLRDEDKNRRVGFTFSRNDKEILDYLKPIINSFYGYDIKEVLRENGVYHLSYHSKYFVEFFKNLGIKAWSSEHKEAPESIYTAPKEAVIGFLQGLFTADGTIGIQDTKGVAYIRLTAKSQKLLKDVQLLLLNLGIRSRIYNRSRQERTGFEYISKDGKKSVYKLDGICYELSISRNAILLFLEKVGFLGNSHSSKIKKLLARNYHETSFVEKIKSVIPCGEQEVFDLTEPETLTFLSNGFISLDCGEQPLLAYESCNLGSINLSQMVSGDKVDWNRMARTVKVATRFLDNVIDMNKFPLSIIREKTLENRKIGLGVMGFADMLIKLGIPYDSDEALKKAEEIMKFILDKAREASEALAEKRGAFPSFERSVFYERKDKPLRNATLTTIAPTGTLSIIANCSSGIEPIFAVSYVRNVMDNDELVEVHPLFLEMARERGFYSEELMKKIAKAGSVQDIDEVPADIKRLFRTSLDIDPEYHIKMQSAFQRYTNNAVSKTINFPNQATVDDVRKAYMLAFDKGCKGLTIYRDKSREEQVLNIGKVNKETAAMEEKARAVTLKPKPRGPVTFGTTTKVSTGCGNLYVTINNDEANKPFEVFMQMGKAGGCAMSQLEAIGRLLSLALRSGVNSGSIIDQLKGIRCPSPSWEKGGGRIFSCSDAIARVVERRMSEAKELTKKLEEGINYIDPPAESKGSTAGAQATKTKARTGNVVGVCPDCGSALRHIEGCQVCNACGFSKCG